MRKVKVFAIALAVLFALTFSCAHAQSSFAKATANMLDSGLMNAHYTVTSNHFAFIFNGSGASGVFIYAFVLCAQNLSCTTNAFSVYLTSNQGINVDYISYKDIIYTHPGRYTLTAKTMISGPSTNILVQNTAPAVIIDPNNPLPIP